MNKTEQEFLKDLDKKLWSAADKLYNNLDAAVYKMRKIQKTDCGL